MSGQGAVAACEPLALVAYMYDGTLEGLLTCVFESYVRHERPEDMLEGESFQPRLGQSTILVEASVDVAERVRRGIVREAGPHAFGAIVRAFAVDDARKGSVIYEFVRYAMDGRSGRDRRLDIMNDIANPVVGALAALGRRTVDEAEKLRQFARFSHLSNGVWFARCNPNASVVPFVMPHFAARFNIQPFMIYDEVHHLAGVYDGTRWYMVRDRISSVPEGTEEDRYAQALWQRFYDAVTIDARFNPELRRSFIPVRLWKHLPEMRPREQALAPRS